MLSESATIKHNIVITFMHTCTKCLKTETGKEQYDKKGPKEKINKKAKP